MSPQMLKAQFAGVIGVENLSLVRRLDEPAAALMMTTRMKPTTRRMRSRICCRKKKKREKKRVGREGEVSEKKKSQRKK